MYWVFFVVSLLYLPMIIINVHGSEFAGAANLDLLALLEVLVMKRVTASANQLTPLLPPPRSRTQRNMMLWDLTPGVTLSLARTSEQVFVVLNYNINRGQ